jgi:hypothetical protein
MKTLFIAMCFVLGVICCSADSSVDGVTIEVFHVKVSGGKTQASPSSPTGVSVLRDRFDVVEKSSGIPLLKGHGLAVTFTLTGKYQNMDSVRLVVKHPEMKAPTGEVYSKIERVQKALLVDGTRMVSFSYAFDEKWEFVEGIWTIEIFSGDTQLGEAQLIAYDPKKKEPNRVAGSD